jgi:hypothetical protein
MNQRKSPLDLSISVHALFSFLAETSRAAMVGEKPLGCGAGSMRSKMSIEVAGLRYT